MRGRYALSQSAIMLSSVTPEYITPARLALLLKRVVTLLSSTSVCRSFRVVYMLPPLLQAVQPYLFPPMSLISLCRRISSTAGASVRSGHSSSDSLEEPSHWSPTAGSAAPARKAQLRMVRRVSPAPCRASLRTAHRLRSFPPVGYLTSYTGNQVSLTSTASGRSFAAYVASVLLVEYECQPLLSCTRMPIGLTRLRVPEHRRKALHAELFLLVKLYRQLYGPPRLLR